MKNFLLKRLSTKNGFFNRVRFFNLSSLSTLELLKLFFIKRKEKTGVKVWQELSKHATRMSWQEKVRKQLKKQFYV